MSGAVTPKQAKVKKAILDFIAKNGYSPSFKEIGQMVGVTSLSTVHKHVHALAKKQHITIGDFNATRSIAVGRAEEIQCPKCRHRFEVTKEN